MGVKHYTARRSPSLVPYFLIHLVISISAIWLIDRILSAIFAVGPLAWRTYVELAVGFCIGWTARRAAEDDLKDHRAKHRGGGE